MYPAFLKKSPRGRLSVWHHEDHLSADLSQYDVDDLLNEDIKVAHEEEHAAQHAWANMGDAFLGLGIVAAVLGIVHTMGLLDQGPEVIGHHVAAALIGTFLGVLAAYGFVGPMALKMTNDIAAERSLPDGDQSGPGRSPTGRSSVSLC